MTSIQSNNNKNDKSLFIFSKNPIVDAAIWGAGGAIGGAGYSVYNQNKLFKNADKFEKAVESLKNNIAMEKSALNGCGKHLKTYEHELKCLTNKKINLKSVKNWAIGLGLVTLVPQLIFNLIAFAAKKGYDKINEAKSQSK